MASSGTLAIKVVKLDAVHAEDETHKHFSVKVRIGSESKATKHFHAEQPVNETLNFDLTDVTSADDVHFEAFEKDRTKKAKASWKLHLADFFKSEPVLKALKEHNGNVVHIESKWTPKTTTQKIAGEQTAKTVETTKQVVTLHPQRALAIHDTQRPWFLRVSYYYDTTKNVYNYTTSFRVIAPVARFGEHTANTILAKVTGKTLADLDTALVTPNLNSLDQVVDQTIQTVFVKLVEGQSYVLQKKNDAVSTASVVVGSTLEKAGKVKDYTTSSVKSVATTGYNTVASVADYTTSSVKSVASTSYNTVASVADYTTTQVTNVSSSAYGKVRGATVYVVSHVPYLGTKIRA